MKESSIVRGIGKIVWLLLSEEGWTRKAIYATEPYNATIVKTFEIFSCGADSNLTQDGRWTYEWNGENRLIRMTTRSDVPGPHYQLTFQYDWMGRRIRKTVVNLDTGQTISDLIFLYDGWNLIAEVNAQTGELIRTYVWGPDLSGTMQGAGGIGGLLWVTHHDDHGITHHETFVVYDGNGNVMVLISAFDGSLVAQYEYGPFAEPLRATGPLAADNPFRFSTKYTDSETGLVYYGYRYYSPSLGRWLSKDPVEEIYWESPIFLKYVFVKNCSVLGVDRVGLTTTMFILKAKNDINIYDDQISIPIRHKKYGAIGVIRLGELWVDASVTDSIQEKNPQLYNKILQISGISGINLAKLQHSSYTGAGFFTDFYSHTLLPGRRCFKEFQLEQQKFEGGG